MSPYKKYVDAISKAARDAIIMVDDFGKVTFWNDSAVRIFGYTAEEMMGKDLHRTIAPERFIKDYETRFPHFVQTGEGSAINKTIELLGKRKDGQEIPIELSLAAINESGKWNAVGIVRDITERKRNQEQLAEKMVQLEKSMEEIRSTQGKLIQAEKLSGIGQMAAGVAHEINNPLTSILGFAQLMLADSKIKGVDRKNLEIIEKESKRCVRIIENLLDFAKPSLSKRTNFDVNEAAKEALEITQYMVESGKIKIQLKTSKSAEYINGDAQQIEQVFVNIILNAVHAMPKGGDLTINISRHSEKEVAIEFKDTGVGISEDVIGKIFEPFFTTSYQVGKKGTGLGLSVCYSIVKEHGGRIEVVSSKGNGATFTVILPTHKQ